MAEPITGTIAAVASYVSSAFAASAVGTATLAQAATVFAVNAAATVAVNVAATALLQPKVGSSGPTMDFKSDTTAPIRGVMGRMAIGGNRIFKRTWGRTNVYLTSVALLSLGPCQAVEQFKAGEQFVSFGQSQGGASGKYAGHMWMTYRYGLPGTSALTPPQGVFIENPKLTAWTSQHRADGHLTAMWTLAQAEDVQKRDLYTQGEPDALWIGRWMKVWDPRQDSTYPGGSGSQRRDQWNTWGYTDNPYLHAIAWIRGHAKLNADGTVDRTKRIAGVGAPERAIDTAAYIEGANIADANGWKIAGEWSTSDDKWQVLAAMLQAGGGVPLNRGAQISCMVNTPRASIYTYTRNDLVGGATVKALKARRDRKNTVVPRYRSEAHGWEIVPAGAVTSSVYRAEDRGEPRTIEIEYPYVTSAKQAGELGAYDVANMREGLETSLPSKPHLLGLRAGDAFTTDLPELGLVAQKFIVQRRAFDPQTGVVTLDVLSETDAKHAWALGQTANPPPTPSLVGVDPDYVAPPELPEWTVVIRPPASDGSQQPGFEIIGGSPAADASSVVMEHGQSPTGPWKQFYDGALKTTGRVPIDGLQPGETYYVAVRYRRDSSGALSDRAIYGPYTAPSLTAGDVSPNAPGLAQIRADITAAFGDIDDVSGALGLARADLDRHENEIAAAQGRIAAQAANLLTLDNGLDGVQQIVEDHTTQIAGKASRTVVDAEILRLDGVVAVNAAQADTLIDLETNKVALSEYDLLKAEVQAARAGAPTLLAQIAFLQDVDLDLLNNKASTSALDVQTSRIDGAIATNAEQALTLVNLEKNKVGVSTFDSLKAEVEAARGGEASLLGRIQEMNAVDLDLQDKKASVQSVDALTARTEQAEADILTVADAVAEEAGARAEQIGRVAAQAGHRSNLIDNPSGAASFRGWNKEGGPNTEAILDTAQGRIFVVRDYMVSQVYPASAGQKHSLGYNASPVGGGHVRLQYVTPGGLVEGVRVDNTLADQAERRRSSSPALAPAGTTGFRLVVVPPSGGVLPVWAIKVNNGDVATDFSDDYSATVLEASVTSQSLAIIDLETQQALARFELVTAASGGKPARFRMVSSSLGSAIALDAPFIFWGDNTVFDDATDTLQTTIGGNRRVLALGAPFGANGTLLEWWGPSNVPLGAMTTANGFNGRMTVAPYVFDNVVVSGGASQSKITTFLGNIGRTTPVNQAGVTDAMTVPSSGKFIVEINNAFASSPGEASGQLRLAISRNGALTQIVSVPVNAEGESRAVDLSSLNIEVVHAFAGPVSFVLTATGNNVPSEQIGAVRGTMKATYYP